MNDPNYPISRWTSEPLSQRSLGCLGAFVTFLGILFVISVVIQSLNG